MLRFALSAAVLAAAFAAPSAAELQSCNEEPAFAAHRTSNPIVRAGYNALQRGELPEAVHFANEALDSRGSRRHRAAAASNLCAALTQLGDDAALEACDAAVEAGEDNWRAWNNRGAARWLAGDYVGAQEDFTAAAGLESGEAEIIANMSLSQCAVTASR